MSIQMRLLHRLLRLMSDYLMLPFFDAGGTRDSTLGGRLCVLRTIGRKSGQPREIPLDYAPAMAGLVLLAGFGRRAGWVHDLRASDAQVSRVVAETVCFHLCFDDPPAWGAAGRARISTTR